MLLFETKLAQEALMDMLKDVIHSLLTVRQKVRRTAQSRTKRKMRNSHSPSTPS